MSATTSARTRPPAQQGGPGPTASSGPGRSGGPTPPAGPTRPAGGRRRAARGPDYVLLAVVALLAAACLPLLRVFVGFDIVRPVAAALLLSVGLSWAARRSGSGPLTALAVSALGFCLLVAVAFLPTTLAFGVLPTTETIGAARDLWLRGMELVQIRPAPALAESGLVLLAVTGVWWVAHVVEVLVFRLEAPLRAVGMALVLWIVPLVVAPPAGAVWIWAAPLLGAAAFLLLAVHGGELARWGAMAGTQRRSVRRAPLIGAGWPVALTAIAAGAVLAGTLPGFGDPPWYEIRGGGGTTLTTNPIVSIRSNLVTLSEQPIARVTSPRPVYLRLTALDVYGENEEWRSDGIRGGDASGRLEFEAPMTFFGEIDVAVEVQNLPGAVIVPVPYHPTSLAGAPDTRFQYDRNRATVTLREANLTEGDRYHVTAAVPAPPPELLETAPVTPTPLLTALPGDVPVEVADLAREIVTAAGATTPFAQALAIQEELRTWTYSLDPPQGHGASAMRAFLTNRVGYCEQFAGTMAVMLRSLDIPARVAVGFTPGDLVDADAGIYQVRNANAHAWVEVRFDSLGWIAFEPTPRTDGNVLVPSLVDLSPAQTEAQEAAAAVAPQPASTPVPETPDTQDFPERDAFTRDQAQQPAGEAAEGEGGGRGLWILLLVLVGLATGTIATASSRRRVSGAVPAEVVLHAFDGVARLAEGLGRGRRPTETDAEFLGRLAPGSPDARSLSAAVERARWARMVPGADATRATRAAAALRTGLLGDRGRLGRAGLSLRAAGRRARNQVRAAGTRARAALPPRLR